MNLTEGPLPAKKYNAQFPLSHPAGLKTTIVTHNAMLSAFGKGGQWQSAFPGLEKAGVLKATLRGSCGGTIHRLQALCCSFTSGLRARGQVLKRVGHCVSIWHTVMLVASKGNPTWPLNLKGQRPFGVPS